MQIHNYGALQTIFAYNAWGAARTSELGLGNQPGPFELNGDWTFNTSNISNYTNRTLQVFVHQLNAPPTDVTLDGGVEDLLPENSGVGTIVGDGGFDWFFRSLADRDLLRDRRPATDRLDSW